MLGFLGASKGGREAIGKLYSPEAMALKGLIAAGMMSGGATAGAGAGAGGSGTAGASTGGLMGSLGNFGKQAMRYGGQQALSKAFSPETPSQPIYAPPSQMNLNLLNNLNRNYRMQGQRKFFS